MMTTLTTIIKKDLFISCREVEAVEDATFKRTTAGNAWNVALLCPKENTCGGIMKSAWVGAKSCLMYPKIWSLLETTRAVLLPRNARRKSWTMMTLPQKEELTETWNQPLPLKRSKQKMRTFSNALDANTSIGIVGSFFGEFMRCCSAYVIQGAAYVSGQSQGLSRDCCRGGKTLSRIDKVDQ